MVIPLLHGLDMLLDADSPPFFYSDGQPRTCYPTEVFVAAIKSGLAIRLNNPLTQTYSTHNRSLFHFLHWVPTNEFFVSISAMRNKGLNGTLPTALLLAIMPVQQFCQTHGTISTKHFIRAGKRAHAKDSTKDYYAWRQAFLRQHEPAFYDELRLRKVEVFITYQSDDESKEHQATLGRPDVPDGFLEAQGVQNAMNHPNFWEWFYSAIRQRGLQFIKTVERATGIFLRVIDEAPISIRPPAMATA